MKNGAHCAFAHGANDLRPPVYDSREQREMMDGGDTDKLGPNSLDKERSLLNDDPKWLDTTYVLANYKTEQCKKPPRLCRYIEQSCNKDSSKLSYWVHDFVATIGHSVAN